MKRLGIYIHIPFCVKKCNYCDFLSFVPTKVEEYIDALVTEIITYELKDKYLVDTIFFGGGTPSILSVQYLEKILKAIREKFNMHENAEVSLEVNPETVDRMKLEQIKQLGINRLSIGLQSTNNVLLRKLGRIHTFEKFLDIYKSSREIGYNNINIDLMLALPGQSILDYKYTLDKVISLKPEHISSYGLIIEEGTNFFDLYNEENGSRREEISNEETYLHMYELTQKALEKEGYFRYEISNYAKKGYECKHNLKYWKRDDYIGFGLGASSCIGDKRLKNTSVFNEYLENNYNRDIEELSNVDIFNEYIMLGLRMSEGIDIEKIYNNTGIEIDKQKLQSFKQSGYLYINANNICLTMQGMEVSSHIISELIK